jgi:putative membrane protein
MRLELLVAVAAGYAMTAVSWGQSGNPAFADPSTPGIETGRPAEDKANASDHVFLRAAAVGNRAEIETGNLAERRAQEDSVKAFASRMVADHQGALRRIETLARGSETPLPRELDMDHQVVLSQLQETPADAFDVAYVRSQIVDHQRTVQLLQYQINNGQSDQVRTFAKEMLRPVMEHLELAKALHSELTGAAP